MSIQPFQFIHAADLHLGCTFKGVHSVNETVAKALQEATYVAFNRIVDLAIEKQVAFVLFAGDIYDRTENSLQAQLRFRDGLLRLEEAGIASCVVHGNHDPLDGKAQALQWPQGCHRFSTTGTQLCVMAVNGTPVAAVAGVSYGQRDVSRSLLEFYTHTHDSLFTIGLLHTNCGGNLQHGNYAPCTLEQLKTLPFDYWALGHIHKPTVLHPERPAVVYAGTPQGLNPKETGEHGCYLVAVDAVKNVSLEFVPLGEVLWQQERLCADSWDNEEQAITALEDALQRIASSAEPCSVLWRLEIVGRTSLHSWLNHRSTQEDLLERLRSLSPQVPFVWTDRLTVATAPQIDLDARAQSDDIVGEILRQAQSLAVEEMYSELTVLFDHARAGRVLEKPTEEQLNELRQRAAVVAAGGLLEDEVA